MGKRIDLSWGGGELSVVLNLRDGQLHAYKGSEQLHNEFGGKCYYTSRSGRSGAGYIDGNPLLRTVGTYRTDTAFLDWPRSSTRTVGTMTVVVPISYSGHSIDHSYPIVVRDENTITMVTSIWSLHGILTGQPQEEYEIRDFTVKYIPDSCGYEENLTVSVNVPSGKYKTGNIRRVIEAMNMGSIAFKYPEEGYTRLAFWSRLGLVPIGNRLFKVTGRVCRGVYQREALDSLEKLAEVSPKNVVWLAPGAYLQETAGGFEAVGLFTFGKMEADFEMCVDTSRAIRAMNGDFAGIVTELQEGAQQKLHLEHQASLPEVSSPTVVVE